MGCGFAALLGAQLVGLLAGGLKEALRDNWAHPSRGDRGFESLYPSERLLAVRHCRLAEPGRPTGSSPRILCFEHLKRTCASAGRPRRKSRGRLRLERRVMSQQCWMPGRLCSAPTERGPACKKGAYPSLNRDLLERGRFRPE